MPDSINEGSSFASLRGRIPQIDAAAANTLPQLIATDRALPLDGAVLRFNHAIPAERLVRLSSSLGDFALALDDDDALPSPGARHWSDYDAAEARLLAWALAHEALLDLLGRALRTAPPLPLALQLAPSEAPSLIVGFRAELGSSRCCGQLWLMPAMLQALSAHPAWTQMPDPARRRLQPPMTLELNAATRQLTLAEWRATTLGDVLVLGAASRVWRELTLHSPGTPRAWRAARTPAGLQLLTVATDEQTAMENISMDTDPRRADAPGAAPLQNPVLSLDFELVRLTLTLAELEQLQAGSVIPLPDTLDDATVTVRTAGRAIARGRLVAMGDTLGVQLTELPERLPAQ